MDLVVRFVEQEPNLELNIKDKGTLENVVTSRDRIVTDHLLWGLLDVMIARADRGAVQA